MDENEFLAICKAARTSGRYVVVKSIDGAREAVEAVESPFIVIITKGAFGKEHYKAVRNLVD